MVVAAVLAELAIAKRAKNHRGAEVPAKGVQGLRFRAAKSRPRSQQHQVSQWQPRWRKRPSKPGMTMQQVRENPENLINVKFALIKCMIYYVQNSKIIWKQE